MGVLHLAKSLSVFALADLSLSKIGTQCQALHTMHVKLKGSNLWLRKTIPLSRYRCNITGLPISCREIFTEHMQSIMEFRSSFFGGFRLK
jgi:hypothetical protein